jgi:hypothetical protein
MDLQVTADVDAAVTLMAGLGSAAEDLQPAFVEIGAVLEASATVRFNRDGDGDWPPLTAATLARRRRAGIMSTEALEVHGRLRASLTTGLHPDGIREVRGDRLIWGSSLDYAVYVANRRQPLPDVDGQLAHEMADTLLAHMTGGR